MLTSAFKALFNIVETPFFFYFDVCAVWWCSGGPINSHEYKRFEMYALCSHYQDIHDWISPQNKPSGLPLIWQATYMGRNESDISDHHGHLSISLLWNT